MRTVLTTGAFVTCGHPPAAPVGKVTLASSAKLRVGQNPVLLASALVHASVVGCPSTTLNTNDVSCVQVSAVTGGTSTKLRVAGQPAILDSLAGTTQGTVGGTTPQTLLSGKDPGSVLRAS